MSKQMELDEAANLLGKHIAGLGDSDLAGLTIVTFVDSLQDGDTPRMALALARDVENDVEAAASELEVEQMKKEAASAGSLSGLLYGWACDATGAVEEFQELDVPRPPPVTFDDETGVRTILKFWRAE